MIPPPRCNVEQACESEHRTPAGDSWSWRSSKNQKSSENVAGYGLLRMLMKYYLQIWDQVKFGASCAAHLN
ncbi:hypothetical protein CMV_018038 [Castanea mollissima]|uniref:Uncharacterized protein n=1 Tax=Castanea mollissima TaxID=60419 RepID=A0A8J4QQ15_9ROSI|nr:hypothetical protein CMV_018038 [Castanea mollissima]